jgi:uncharacterized metal-binding protein
MKEQEKSNICRSGPKLIFACSGAADVGEIADLAARKLNKEGSGKMFCLAGIGGCVEGIMKNTEAAKELVAIDGCPLDCAKKTLERGNFNEFMHVRLTDIGLEKGASAVTDENIKKVTEAVCVHLGTE